MKKNTLLFAAIIFSVNVFPQITFLKRYGVLNGGIAYSVKQTSDSGYIATGFTPNYGAGLEDIYLVKTDYKGDTLWTKTFGGAELERGYTVQQTTDGGYFITGFTTSFGALSNDIYIIKTDANGLLTWSRTFNGTSLSYTAVSGRQVHDGGYIIVGNTDNFGTGGYNVYLIRLDGSGNLQWAKTYGGPSEEAGECVEETSDNGFIITGYTASYGAGGMDIYLLKTDSIGNLVFSKTYGGAGHETGKSVVQTADGGYMICGYTQSFGAGSSDLYLVRTDANGDMLWNKTYGTAFADEGYSVIEAGNGGYVATGFTYGSSFTGTDLYLINVSDTGALIWERTYSLSSASDIGYSVRQTLDGSYVVCGSTLNSGPSSSLMLLKMDSIGRNSCAEIIHASSVQAHSIQVLSHTPDTASGTGVVTPLTVEGGAGGSVITLCTSIGINEISSGKNIIISPNPASSQLRIYDSGLGVESVEIFNTLGEKVYGSEETSQSNSETINVSKLNPGIYFVKMRTSEVMMAGKFVKQ